MEKRPKEPPATGPAEKFNGEVTIEQIAKGEPPSQMSVISVHFHAGARTAWHSHSAGQTLHCTDGEGIVQARGEEAMSLLPGDTVHTPKDEWHWHGGTADHHMTHLSITEGVTTWGDHVTDEEYRSAHGH